jgi:hypothetical protein
MHSLCLLLIAGVVMGLHTSHCFAQRGDAITTDHVTA